LSSLQTEFSTTGATRFILDYGLNILNDLTGGTFGTTATAFLFGIRR
jgi:hypothetical protein